MYVVIFDPYNELYMAVYTEKMHCRPGLIEPLQSNISLTVPGRKRQQTTCMKPPTAERMIM